MEEEHKHCCVIDTDKFYCTEVFVEFIPNESGQLVERVQGYILKEGETLIETDSPFFKAHTGALGFVHPRWDGAAWIEGATSAEIAAWDVEHPAPPPTPPTPTEILQAENRLLRAQITAESDRTDFIEECIAEMAAQVYT